MSDTELRFFIWSWEHEAWWGPDFRGYVQHAAQAGLYTEDQAADIVVGHIPPGEEVAVLAQWALKHGRPPAYSFATRGES